MLFKRSQKQASEESQNWYQDKYQHVLTQRNVLALVALAALGIALVMALNIARLAPLKSVQPYLLQIDERSGITQKVNPMSRQEYIAKESIDRYFTSTYLRARESYNPAIMMQNYNTVRLMSAGSVFDSYRNQVNPAKEGTVANHLGQFGRRDVKIRGMVYIVNPANRNQKASNAQQKIIQARITTVDSMPNAADLEQNWVVTITFEYANLAINELEQLVNPLGYQVTTYQIQREIN